MNIVKELFCHHCKSKVDYSEVLEGTIKLTDSYIKDLRFCPNCLTHSNLEDIS